MISRRGFFTGTAIAAVSATTATIATSNLNHSAAPIATKVLERSEKFFGQHQSGIAMTLQSFTTFIAFDLKELTDKPAMLRWMRLITDDINKLMSGKPVIADPQAELSLGPARTTVTVGFGPDLFKKLDIEGRKPNTFEKLPTFRIDKLQDEFSDGDVLLHISADDPLVLSHATRALVRDCLSFARVRWTQSGFTNAQGISPEGSRQRNLMGQVDGTDNPELNSEDFNNLVWIDDGPDWVKSGTILVLRRIAMNLNTWDSLGREQKEQVIGRNLRNGAPLTGTQETDIPDFEAVKANGLKVIPTSAHIRRASPVTMNERFFRRPFNYDDGLSSDGQPNVGLLWTAYMRDMNQYIGVQRRLAEFDLLNVWTTPIGSSVWAIPGGVDAGELLAEKLFI